MQEQLDFFGKFQELLERNAKSVGVFLALLTCTGLVYGVVSYRRSVAQQEVYRSFVQLNKLVDAAVHDKDDASIAHDHTCFTTENEKWTAVAVEAQGLLDQHAATSFGGHFAVIRANALLRQNKAEEALLCLRENLDKLPNTPVKEQVQAFKALLMLDSGDEASHQAGKQELEKIAAADGVAADYAAYWLGQYHWAQGNTHEAKIVWNTMVAENNKVIMGRNIATNDLADNKSPWIAKARKILKTIQ